MVGRCTPKSAESSRRMRGSIQSSEIAASFRSSQQLNPSQPSKGSGNHMIQRINNKSRLPGIFHLLQRLPWIDKAAILADLKVQVGAGGIASGATGTNDLAFTNHLTAGYTPAV